MTLLMEEFQTDYIQKNLDLSILDITEEYISNLPNVSIEDKENILRVKARLLRYQKYQPKQTRLFL